MPFRHGKGTEVLLDGLDLSPYLNAADDAIDVEPGDTTTFKATWKSAIPGLVSAKVDLSGYYDPAELSMRNLLGANPALNAGVLTLAPGGGQAIGDLSRLVSVEATSYAESSPVGGVVGIKWSVLSSTAVGIGLVLHPLAADVNTTTGAERDDAAATATGWTAHLHVLAVTGGSWVVKLQDAAVTNTYTDVAGGAFAAATGAGGQRLLSASGATLRRFVRYVATRTGGVVGDSITFSLSYARN